MELFLGRGVYWSGWGSILPSDSFSFVTISNQWLMKLPCSPAFFWKCPFQDPLMACPKIALNRTKKKLPSWARTKSRCFSGWSWASCVACPQLHSSFRDLAAAKCVIWWSYIWKKRNVWAITKDRLQMNIPCILNRTNVVIGSQIPPPPTLIWSDQKHLFRKTFCRSKAILCFRTYTTSEDSNVKSSRNRKDSLEILASAIYYQSNRGAVFPPLACVTLHTKQLEKA